MFLCLECTIVNRFSVWCYCFGKIVTVWFHSPTHGNKLNREKYVNLLSSANKDVSIVNLTEKSSVKEVLSNFLIAKAILTSENSCESCTWIAKKKVLPTTTNNTKKNKQNCPDGLQDRKRSSYFLRNYLQCHTQPIRIVGVKIKL